MNNILSGVEKSKVILCFLEAITTGAGFYLLFWFFSCYRTAAAAEAANVTENVSKVNAEKYF